jgi:hypothetical protein
MDYAITQKHNVKNLVVNHTLGNAMIVHARLPNTWIYHVIIRYGNEVLCVLIFKMVTNKAGVHAPTQTIILQAAQAGDYYQIHLF